MISLSSFETTHKVKKAISEIEYALKNGIEPEKIPTATFPAYLMKDCSHHPRAIFKPSTKEEDGLKEYAAFLLDHKNFAGVPETTITFFEHPILGGSQKGSFQLFHEGNSPAKEAFNQLDAPSIRRIACLDIRLLNIDRNLNNFLVCKEGIVVPIDHNLILPNYFGSCFFAWSDWKESQTPFSDAEKGYLSNLNPHQDRQLLLNLGLNSKAANLCFFATLALQIGADLGLTAYQLAFFFELRKQRDKGAPSFNELLKSTGYKSNLNFTFFIRPFCDSVKKMLFHVKRKVHEK